MAGHHALGKGPCLIARPGSNLPNCHERDFCACDVRAAAEWGLRRGVELAAERCESLSEYFDGQVGDAESEILNSIKFGDARGSAECAAAIRALLEAEAPKEGR